MTCKQCQDAKVNPRSAFFAPGCVSCDARAFALCDAVRVFNVPAGWVELRTGWITAVRQFDAQQARKVKACTPP